MPRPRGSCGGSPRQITPWRASGRMKRPGRRDHPSASRPPRRDRAGRVAVLAAPDPRARSVSSSRQRRNRCLCPFAWSPHPAPPRPGRSPSFHLRAACRCRRTAASLKVCGDARLRRYLGVEVVPGGRVRRRPACSVDGVAHVDRDGDGRELEVPDRDRAGCGFWQPWAGSPVSAGSPGSPRPPRLAAARADSASGSTAGRPPRPRPDRRGRLGRRQRPREQRGEERV